MISIYRFEKYKIDGEYRYAICSYATVYLYYAYPNKTRPRISQFLTLPPFQRMGIGAELLNVIYRSFMGDQNILDITGNSLSLIAMYSLYIQRIFFSFSTVEDPSEEFVRLRDYVDAANCMKLDAFSNDKLSKGFSSEMVEEAKSTLLVNKVPTITILSISFLFI